MSTLGVFIALGGTSYAVTKLPRNSVGSRQIKRDAVTGDKIKDGAVSRADLAADAALVGPRGSRGTEGPRGLAGPAGGTGPQGDVGPRGPSDALVDYDGTTLLGYPAGVPIEVNRINSVPAGNWIMHADGTLAFFPPGADVTIASCSLRINGDQVQGVSVVVGSGAVASQAHSFSLSAGVKRTESFTASLTCDHGTNFASGPQPYAQQVTLTLVRVQNLAVTGP